MEDIEYNNFCQAFTELPENDRGHLKGKGNICFEEFYDEFNHYFKKISNRKIKRLELRRFLERWALENDHLIYFAQYFMITKNLPDRKPKTC